MHSPDTVRLASGPPRSASSHVLGRYRLITRLGAGGFGVVWLAHDERLAREVAVKRIPLGPGGDRDRAAREAMATARLAHPAIVALYEAGADDEAFYLVSELVRGCTLADLIAEDALADEEILGIGVALVDALAHAHARGVIHRDVKPQNVLVPGEAARRGRRSPPAKLADFGGARLTGEEGMTRTGDVIGTLAYMAPEQAEGRAAGPPADLYSVALVLYEALTGNNPVRGATPAATARRLGTPLPSLARSRPGLNRGLAVTVDAALDPVPSRRGSLAELRVALLAALEQAPGARATPRPARPDHGPPRDLAPAPATPRPGSPGARAMGGLGAGLLFAGILVVLARCGAWPAALAGTAAGTLVALLPRAGWLAGTLALCAWMALHSRGGTALVVAAAALPAAWVLRRPGAAWSLPALAPLLGLIGLAGAFPALAGLGGSGSRRAACGALGFWWLALGEAASGRRLWWGPVSGVPVRGGWARSVAATASHVLQPLLSPSVAAGVVTWAAAAAILPWILRGRSVAVDLAAVAAWSAFLVATTIILPHPGGAQGALVAPRGLYVGVLVGAVAAVLARAGRGPRAASGSRRLLAPTRLDKGMS